MHVDALSTQALAERDLTLICAYPNYPATAAVTPNPDRLPADQFIAHHPLPPPSELGTPDDAHILDRRRGAP
jgi:hypothetical protein